MHKTIAALLCGALMLAGLPGCGNTGVPEEEYEALEQQYDELAEEEKELTTLKESYEKQIQGRQEDLSAAKKMPFNVDTVGDTAFVYPSAWSVKDIGDKRYYYYKADAFMFSQAVDTRGAGPEKLEVMTDAVVNGMLGSGGGQMSKRETSKIGGTTMVCITAQINADAGKVPTWIYCFVQGRYFVTMVFCQQGGFTKDYSEQILHLLQSTDTIEGRS